MKINMYGLKSLLEFNKLLFLFQAVLNVLLFLSLYRFFLLARYVKMLERLKSQCNLFPLNQIL